MGIIGSKFLVILATYFLIGKCHNAFSMMILLDAIIDNYSSLLNIFQYGRVERKNRGINLMYRYNYLYPGKNIYL